ncbi:MAG: hypothetical protein SGI72_06765 [Planctomycetota bacterium]|nr:hypothetical protein [Planctomycetota bacterium]
MMRPQRALVAVFVCVLVGILASRELVDASTVVKMSIEDLATRSDLALEARVTSKSATLDTTGRIATDYALTVERTFTGPNLMRRTVRIPGGTLPDGRGLHLPGMPTLAVGESALLFLSAENPRGERIPIGLAQGRLLVRTATDGVKTLVTDLADLDFVDAGGRPIASGPRTGTLPYAATIARVEAARAERIKEAKK